MALDAKKVLAISKKYTQDTVEGAGAVAGKPCQIQSITEITGGHRVTFLWVDNSSVQHTSTMDVMNGQDGQDGQDGKGIQSVSVNALNHLILTYTDGTTVDAGEIEISSAVTSVCGKTGNVTLDAEDVGALADDTPLPTKVSDLTNDSAFIQNTVDNLTNYYLKTQTYTKDEVNTLVNNISAMTLDIVETLPTTDISTTTIYLIETSAGSNVYIQWAYINNEWAQLGTTQVDLTNYYTKSQTDALLADKQDTLTFDNVPTSGSTNPVKSAGVLSAINDAVATKQDTLTFDNAPTSSSNNPVKSGGVFTALSGKQDTLTFDATPTGNSTNPVTSGGVFEALQNVDVPVATTSTAGKVKPDGITITVDANGVISGVYDVDLNTCIPKNAGARNSIYRGKSLGTSVTPEQYAAIASGTFDDLFIGDYWTIGGIVYRIADFDYWLHTGDTECTTHHVVVVLDSNFANQKMNDSDTTAGGYVGSKMATSYLATARNTINTAFGTAHILSHRELFTTAVTNGAASGWAWSDSTIDLMSECMIYGHNAWGAHKGYETGIDKTQLSLFRLRPDLITNRAVWWLRGVVAEATFACVRSNGVAADDGASTALGVRPAFGIIG